jgi:hypothetical protein
VSQHSQVAVGRWSEQDHREGAVVAAEDIEAHVSQVPPRVQDWRVEMLHALTQLEVTAVVDGPRVRRFIRGSRPAGRTAVPTESIDQFICVTIVDIDFDLLAFSRYPSLPDIIASVALTFFAYLGFSVITFAVVDLRDPERELPKAMYLALGVTSATYVLISLGVFGTLTVDEVTGFGETAIAEAARPTLGETGFVMMAIAALLATASSVNATLYASGGLTAMLASMGQFPPFFGRDSRLGSHGGLLITSSCSSSRT